MILPARWEAPKAPVKGGRGASIVAVADDASKRHAEEEEEAKLFGSTRRSPPSSLLLRLHRCCEAEHAKTQSATPSLAAAASAMTQRPTPKRPP